MFELIWRATVAVHSDLRAMLTEQRRRAVRCIFAPLRYAKDAAAITHAPEDASAGSNEMGFEKKAKIDLH